MPLRIRLTRCGHKHRPFYRIVSIDSRKARNAKPLEVLGTYDPFPDKQGLKPVYICSDRIKYWIGVGASPSDRVAWLLGKVG